MFGRVGLRVGSAMQIPRYLKDLQIPNWGGGKVVMVQKIFNSSKVGASASSITDYGQATHNPGIEL
jgi:hypothetical protein